MVKYIFILLFIFAALVTGKAQELQCEVVVNSDQVQLTDRRVFVDMRNAMATFMNNRRWTKDVYKPEERIKCRLLITITSAPRIGTYEAVAQIVTSRPVYGTGFETPLIALTDKSWYFDYVESQPLQFSENAFTSNLASLLSYYAYTVIGMDKDSFGKLAGSPLYDRAMQVLNNASSQAPDQRGWKSSEDNQRNRYWLLNNLQDPQLEPFRQGVYLYHRQGMDIFIQEPEKARANMLEAIKGLQRIAQLKPNTAVLRSFFETKADEIVSVFKGAPPADKQAVYTVLSQIDPTNINKYQVIIQR